MSPADPALQHAKMKAIHAALQQLLSELRFRHPTANLQADPDQLRRIALTILNALRALDGARRREGMRRWHQRESNAALPAIDEDNDAP